MAAPASRSPLSCPVCEIHAESVFRVEGMDCHEEVAILDKRLKGLPGLERMSAEVISGRLRVAYDAAQLSAADISRAIADTGMRAWLEREHPTRVADLNAPNRVRLLQLSGAACGIGLALHSAGAAPVVATLAFGVTVAAGGWFWFRRAWSSARLFSLDINVLMVLAVIGAIAIGEWSEAAVVTFLFALAQWLETRNLERARLAIRALMELAPNDALVRRGDEDVKLSLDEISVGDLVIVRPGEKIPLDGTVAGGSSDVNEAPVTGESMPVPKASGASVFAGTINGHGALDVRVTRLKADSTLARIMALVEQAQSERAPTQTFVERFARFYTPAVVVLAAALAAVPPVVFHQPFGPWLYRALVMLVISCPCALVISTPVSIVSALAGAARKGVLIKGGRHLETLGRVRCMAFDKTGTLTHGAPEVVDIVAVDPWTPRDVLRIASALEGHSDHPVARAVLRRAMTDGVIANNARDHQALPGLGAAAIVDGAPALIGNARLFETRELPTAELDARLRAAAGRGRTPVFVAVGGDVIGALAVADGVREAGRSLVELLHANGVSHVAMLSGDHPDTAAAIAGDLGIADAHGGLLPDGKVAAIRALRAEHGTVVMVGDGVNDAPALAAADVGIAMGAAGTDAALETADVALMADDLMRIPYAVRLGRATVRNIRVNIAVALGLKTVFLVLAAMGHATLWMAVVADMGASLLVIANGLRLLRFD